MKMCDEDILNHLIQQVRMKKIISTSNLQFPNHLNHIYLTSIYKTYFISENQEVSKTKPNCLKETNKIRFTKLLSQLPYFISSNIYEAVLSLTGQTHLTLEGFLHFFDLMNKGSFRDISDLVFKTLDFNSDNLINVNDIVIILINLPKRLGKSKLNNRKLSKRHKHKLTTTGTITEIEDYYAPFLGYKSLNYTEFFTIVSKMETNNLVVFLAEHLLWAIPTVENQKSSLESLKLSPNDKDLPTETNLLESNQIVISRVNTLENNDEIGRTSYAPKRLSGINHLPSKAIRISSNVEIIPLMPQTVTHVSKDKRETKRSHVFSKLSHTLKLGGEVTLSDQQFKNNQFYLLDNDILKKVLIEFDNGFLIVQDFDSLDSLADLKLIEQKSYFFLKDAFVKTNDSKLIDGKYWTNISLILENNEYVFAHMDKTYTSLFAAEIRRISEYINIFDYYEFVKELFVNNVERVCLAKDKTTEEEQIIKVVRKSMNGIDMYKHYKTEVDVLGVISHPNIVQFRNFYENSMFAFIVIEYLKLGSLADFVKAYNFDLSETIYKQVLHQIASAIFELNKYGIIHKGLKPLNIMVDTYFAQPGTKKEVINTKLIHFEQCCTTPGIGVITEAEEFDNYTAPELLIEKTYDYSVDVWSFGVLQFFIMSGQYPYFIEAAKNTKELKLIFAKDFKFPISMLRFSRKAWDLNEKCLKVNPSERITIKEILKHPWFMES